MQEKSMKTENKQKKEGQNSLTGVRRQKPLKKFEGKRQKLAIDGSVEEREPKSF